MSYFSIEAAVIGIIEVQEHYQFCCSNLFYLLNINYYFCKYDFIYEKHMHIIYLERAVVCRELEVKVTSGRWF